MAKPEEYYTIIVARTLASLIGMARISNPVHSCICRRGFASNGKTAAQHKGSVNRLTTTIPLDHIIIDELHLFLRIFDVLLRNLIMIVTVLDKDLRDKTAMHLTKLVNCIKSCGVSFNVWESDTVMSGHP